MLIHQMSLDLIDIAMKTLEIYPNMTLAHLRQHFTEMFPYLELELVADQTESDGDSDRQTMDDLAGSITHCCFLIKGDMSVADLEDNFRACFGLATRINRWSGYAWHDTVDTRHWTLDQQNRKGAAMNETGVTLKQRTESD